MNVPHGTPLSEDASPTALFLNPETAAPSQETPADITNTKTAPGALSSLPSLPSLQPTPNIAEYLDKRSPVPHYTEEESLFVTLPMAVRQDLKRLLGIKPGGGAFGHVAFLLGGTGGTRRAAMSVQAACREARNLFKVPGSLKRFRARFDLWSKTKDWVKLVNRAKAGADWQDREDGLPAEFLKYCAAQFGKSIREDGKRQALLAIKRQWLTGRNNDGERAPIPGYGFREAWLKNHPTHSPHQSYPLGWHYSNILRQIKAANLFGGAVRSLLHLSTAAAKDFLPGVRFDRNRAGADGGPLRFLECIEFDDVKVDFLIIDPESGQVCDLWLLIARDRATSLLLGFGMRPARTREDGTQEHLRLRDMKQLCGWILERYGLAPYLMVWKIEHGTATLSEGSRAALRELLPDRVDISYSSMLGGASPTGYQQRAVGNSKGKASLESHNRLMHTMLADRAGQTGPLYTKRPADLAARAKEAVQIWQTAQQLPAHLRNQVGYPVLTINQAREHLFRIFRLQNERTEHEMQGFEEVVELWDAQRALWLPQSQVGTTSTSSPSNLQARKRKESPLERCARLITPYRDQWSQVSPEIIRSFYEHTCRQIRVLDNSLIEFRTDDRSLEFMPPSAEYALVPGTRCLGYFHPDDPAFLHLTNGKGSVLGTWLRRARASDAETLATAIRYSQTALSTAQVAAAEYADPQRQELEAMRARNAELLAANTFTDVACIGGAGRAAASVQAVQSPVASSLTATKRAIKAAQKQSAEDDADARAALRKSASMF